MKKTLMDVYSRMLERYGPQGWWPAKTRFEVMIGAVLTQATTWANVEKAVANLASANALSPDAIRAMPKTKLAQLIYSTGYYNAKARKLKALAEYLGQRFGDDLEAMTCQDGESLRLELLKVHGIGEETADDILLYAAGKPVFVIDAFTRRVFSRLRLAPEKGGYSTYQDLFIRHLPPDPELFGEYHALTVIHAKDVCKKRPFCEGCCLLDLCPAGKDMLSGGET